MGNEKIPWNIISTVINIFSPVSELACTTVHLCERILKAALFLHLVQNSYYHKSKIPKFCS